MAIKLAGSWELGWNTPIKEADQWEFMAKEYGVHSIIMEPVSGILRSMFEETHSLLESINEHRALGYVIVFCDESCPHSLSSFTHPSGEDVLYVFGKSHFSPYKAGYHQEGDPCVRIVTPNNDGGFWPHQAASIILHDRFVKG